MSQFGQYILIDKIAAGGMAELFKAKKIGIEGFERVLAIKRILPHISSDEEFINMFIAEAKLVAHLSHKNIAQIYDFGKIGENYFIAMEYVKGKDLRALLKRAQEKNKPLRVELAVFIAKEALSALGYAHKQKDSSEKDLKLIHRDVSPQNIIISYEGEVKVIDFGIAKAETHSHTKTGTIKGKLAYMSPEQAWGRTIDHRSDIFSLGIVLYEMITGKRLFQGATEINTLEMVREARIEPFAPPLVAITPTELESMVMKALSKDVEFRYQDASDMERDLGSVLIGLSSADPGIVLKQFMNDIFSEDIKAENRASAEDATRSIKYNRMIVSAPQESGEKNTQVQQEIKPQPKKKTFAYALFTVLVAAVFSTVFLLWPDTPGKNVPSPLPPKEQSAALDNKEVVTAKKAPLEVPQGNLTVNAIPWADIHINGKHYGTTPRTIQLKPGDYSVKLKNPNYDLWTAKVSVSENRTANVSHNFESFGNIIVNAVPWGNVYIDGVLKGQTPITVQKVPARVHEVTISREGYADVRKTIEIKNGASELISVNMQRKGQ